MHRSFARVPDSDKGRRASIARYTAARRAFESGPWRRLTASERGNWFGKSAISFLENADELAELDTLAKGKPRTVARVADVPPRCDIFHYMAGWATRLRATRSPSVFFTRPEPITAFTFALEAGRRGGSDHSVNFPLLMAAWKLAPALATGNCVVLKPAEQTPLTALRLGEILLDAGIPEGVVNIVTGFGEGRPVQLAGYDDVDKIALPARPTLEKSLSSAAAGNLKRSGFELGGKSPQHRF